MGFEKQSDHVLDYIDYGNMRSAIYMASVVVFVQFGVIIKLIYDSVTRPGYYTVSTYAGAALTLGLYIWASVVLILYSVRTIRDRSNNHKRTSLIFFGYTVFCMYVAFLTVYYDYTSGEKMFSFASMAILMLNLLVWPPVVTLGLSVFIFLCWFGVMYSVDGAASVNRLNLFVMWVSMVIVAFSHYRLRFREARKDENLERANAHMKASLMTDELTGIPNMYYFRENAPRLMAKFKEQKVAAYYLYIDIENFKNYNETYGFHTGDDLLRRFASEMERIFSEDIVARISDDHFVALTVESRGKQNAAELRKILHTVQEDVKVELKVGVYATEDYDEDVNLACDRARIACQSVKKHSERHYRLYDQKMEDEMMRRRTVVNTIDTAIEKGYIKVFYQPIVNLADNTVCGMEALARWDDPKLGMLSPAVFIDVLEEYRFIHKLDLCIVDQVCRDISEILQAGREPVSVSINFSRLDFELCDMVYELKKRADRFRIDPKYIDIEITETALTESNEEMKELIDRLHEAGFNLWLDDFGSGYSSLNVLKDYDFDVMKLDMMFLNGMEDNDRAKPILNNVVRMAKDVSMKSLTEGVETSEQAEYLKHIGCERAQGFYFAKPMQLGDLDNHLKEKGLEYCLSPEKR